MTFSSDVQVMQTYHRYYHHLAYQSLTMELPQSLEVQGTSYTRQTLLNWITQVALALCGETIYRPISLKLGQLLAAWIKEVPSSTSFPVVETILAYLRSFLGNSTLDARIILHEVRAPAMLRLAQQILNTATRSWDWLEYVPEEVSAFLHAADTKLAAALYWLQEDQGEA